MDASQAPSPGEIFDLIEELRSPLYAAKVRQIASGLAGDVVITEDYQEIIGNKGSSVDRSWIFEYSAAQYASWNGFLHQDDAISSPPWVQQVYKVKWSNYTQCPVDEDCGDQTQWGISQQAQHQVSALLTSIHDEFKEYIDDGNLARMTLLQSRMAAAKDAMVDLVDTAEESWYEAIRTLSAPESEVWKGDDADEAHEQFGAVIRQAGQTQEAMARTLETAAAAEAATKAALHVGLHEALKNAHNTIYQKTYLDHMTTFPLLGTVGLVIGAITLPVSLGTTVAVVGFAAGAMNYFGKDVEIDITVSHALNQDEADDLVADLREAAREINEARVALRKQLKEGLEAQFDPFFYSAATGALDLIPGQSLGED
ncbi:hypothetical protein AB0B28_05555 [Glycomyces sp. NPDC046736]|uniref:hypothetical protein n=1 Tax=Glycomyces sp. NPDC046736 TaxID=3155615 RepID=UPI0033D8B888